MRVTWYTDDGYAGRSRPQSVHVDDTDIAECETEEEFKDLINDAVQSDFENKVSYYFTMPKFEKSEKIDEE